MDCEEDDGEQSRAEQPTTVTVYKYLARDDIEVPWVW